MKKWQERREIEEKMSFREQECAKSDSEKM
jgi:hypothetical protein